MWYHNVNTNSLIKINSSDERTSTSADIRFKHFLVIVFDCLPVLKDFLFPESKSCLRFVTKVLKTWFAVGSRGVRQWENLHFEKISDSRGVRAIWYYREGFEKIDSTKIYGQFFRINPYWICAHPKLVKIWHKSLLKIVDIFSAWILTGFVGI